MTTDELARDYFRRARLRREREAAFYGEIDLIPGQSYDLASAQQALADADRILAALDFFETH